MDFGKLKNKTIGILGLGYIGKNLYDYLKIHATKLGAQVIAFDRGNINDLKAYDFDYFFNAAGNSGDFRTDIFATLRSNLDVTIYLLENLNVKKKYVALSSTRIYGFSKNKDTVFDEASVNVYDHKNIDYIYDGTKKLMESILINFPNKDFNISIARLSNVYGNFNNLNDSTLIKKIIKHRTEGKELLIKESIANTSKDYIYIEDALKGIILAALRGKNREVYNIASGMSYSAAQIAEKLELKLNMEKDGGDAVFSNISIEKSISQLNFAPIVDIKTGLKNL